MQQGIYEFYFPLLFMCAAFHSYTLLFTPLGIHFCGQISVNIRRENVEWKINKIYCTRALNEHLLHLCIVIKAALTKNEFVMSDTYHWIGIT